MTEADRNRFAPCSSLLPHGSLCDLCQTILTAGARVSASQPFVTGGTHMPSSQKPVDPVPLSDNIFEQMFRNHAAMMIIVNTDTWRIMDINRAAAAFIGMELKELMKITVFELASLSGISLSDDLERTLNDPSGHGTLSFTRPSGEAGTVEAYYTTLDIDGTNCLFGVLHDITERTEMTDFLRINRNLSVAASGCTAPQDGIKLFLHAALELAGCDCGAFFSLNMEPGGLELVITRGFSEEYMRESEFSGSGSFYTSLVREGRPICRRFEKTGPQEADIHCREGLRSLSIFPVINDGKVLGALFVGSRRLSELPKTSQTALETMSGQFGVTLSNLVVQERLRESEARFRLVTKNIADTIWVMDLDTNRCRYVSPSVQAMSGYSVEEVLSFKLHDIVLPADAGRVEREIALRAAEFESGVRRSYTDELDLVLRDRSTIRAEIVTNFFRNNKNNHIELFGVTRDITEKYRMRGERERMERQRTQTQKLESLGILAGGIAHDFNNLMAGIFGNIDLALSATGDSTVSGYLTNALGAIYRARSLTQQLLTFAKGGAPVRKPQSCIQLVMETTRFALSGSNVAPSFDMPDDLWMGVIDREQIVQAIENIVINGQQAMPAGGAMFITGRNVKLADNEHPTLLPGNYVRISITDQGTGIAPDLLSSIFDPFFTTKSKGKGLGLSTCYSIMRRHGGAIDVESEIGRGSTFHLFLPALAHPEKLSPSGTGPLFRGSGTVIVMDDEEVVRNSTAQMLRGFGFNVRCATNGAEALEMYREELTTGKEPCAIILDLTIPGGMGGQEVGHEIRKTDDHTPIFIASGYADNPIMTDPQKSGFTASIQKPFRMEDLAALLSCHLR